METEKRGIGRICTGPAGLTDNFGMATRRSTLVLGAGGPASLVALAMCKDAGGATPGLLYVHDGRSAARARLEHARRQADFFALTDFHELHLPHLHSKTATAEQGAARSALSVPQLLLAAVQLAGRRGFDEVVWPACRGDDPDAVALALEQTTLVQHLAQAERDLDAKRSTTTDVTAAVTIQTPLLDLNAAAVLNLGERVGASWALAWSCLSQSQGGGGDVGGGQPCGACGGCRHRRRAFEEAGIVDPLDPSTQARHAVRAA